MKKIITVIAPLLISQSLQAQTLHGFDAKFYGFIKASATYSSEALASFNNINLSAPTHAVGQTRDQDQVSRLSFQGQQSRLGVNIQKGENVSGRLEFDFIDFNKSSPTTQMNPRVRIASVTYKEGNSTFIFGQDWDLFSPVTAYTFDIVGLYFMAGNTGFMRQQFQYLHTLGSWELGAAIGMAGNNPGSIDSDLETSKSPSYSARISRKLSNGRIGLSGIFAKLDFDSVGGPNREAYGLNAFYEQTSLGNLALKSELYYGKNLANIGSLSIGRGNASTDVKEFGGTLSGQVKIAENDFIFGGVGLAKADGSEVPNFSLSATNVIISHGVTHNFVSRLGYEHRFTPDFSWLTEVSRYETSTRISNEDQLNIVGAVETGVLLRF